MVYRFYVLPPKKPFESIYLWQSGLPAKKATYKTTTF